MEARIDLITILTDDVARLATFYRDVLGFPVKTHMDHYVEFNGRSVRFAICARATLAEATGHAGYQADVGGPSFELAFPCQSPTAVDRMYRKIITAGATPVKEPANMPWGQRTAFFADPDGNIHELFAELAALPV